MVHLITYLLVATIAFYTNSQAAPVHYHRYEDYDEIDWIVDSNDRFPEEFYHHASGDDIREPEVFRYLPRNNYQPSAPLEPPAYGSWDPNEPPLSGHSDYHDTEAPMDFSSYTGTSTPAYAQGFNKANGPKVQASGQKSGLMKKLSGHASKAMGMISNLMPGRKTKTNPPIYDEKLSTFQKVTGHVKKNYGFWTPEYRENKHNQQPKARCPNWGC